jgi:peptidoglycan hydrolase-like protein with peptidoglycan-binding domain
MKWGFGVALLGIGLLLNADPPAKSKSSNSAQTKPPSKSGSIARKRKNKPAGPSYQTHPDPARYQQIQQALAERGYFKGVVNGIWGDDSVDALKRFQADQKLEDDGKINSLTLIGLGLGPKRDTSSVSVPVASVPKPSPAAAVEGTGPPQ